jgi:hypothetical protein
MLKWQSDLARARSPCLAAKCRAVAVEGAHGLDSQHPDFACDRGPASCQYRIARVSLATHVQHILEERYEPSDDLLEFLVQGLTNSIEAASPGVLWCPSGWIAGRQYSKRENAFRVVLVELRDSDGAPAKQLLDDAKRKVTLLDMNHFGWESQALAHSDEVSVAGDDSIPAHFRPIPDALVIRLP